MIIPIHKYSFDKGRKQALEEVEKIIDELLEQEKKKNKIGYYSIQNFQRLAGYNRRLKSKIKKELKNEN